MKVMPLLTSWELIESSSSGLDEGHYRDKARGEKRKGTTVRIVQGIIMLTAKFKTCLRSILACCLKLSEMENDCSMNG